MQAQQRLNRIQVARQRGTEGAAKRLLLLLLTGVWRALIAHRHSALGAEAAEKLLGAILGGEGPPLPTTSSEEETGGATAELPALLDPGHNEGLGPVGGRGTHPSGGQGLPKEEDGGTVQRHCRAGDCHCSYCADCQGHELERVALRDRVSELEQELSCSQVCVWGGREGQVCTNFGQPLQITIPPLSR